MKFGDIILAVALASVANILVLAFLLMLFIPSFDSGLGLNIATISSALITGLIVGLLFAEQIQEESKLKNIGTILLLAGFIQMFYVLIGDPSNSYYEAYARERLQGMFQTGSWTTGDWYVYEGALTTWIVALTVGLTLAFGSLGLIVGIMLRKTKKAHKIGRYQRPLEECTIQQIRKDLAL